ncbi:hypothetical protein [Novosphingobium sp. Gsoil 351]|uniref:hypothetical protein n=1 Tax=Novosphingobium sp. Gsoil 351 TaxID=2675225 RepID=UPI0012B4DAA2|nr:hypothetical protein [Novosphingobium sp. Gsoil 351]QGN54242.1 hypothetical protein GKE62_06460 [Novosphingobium sp. Gsoil 351]
MSRGQEIREIAHRLLQLADDEDHQPWVRSETVPYGSDSEGAGDPVLLGRLAESMLRARRLRDTHFDPDLFADPAWDMLLDFYVQRAAGRRVDVKGACMAAHVPETTALRWINLLVSRNLIVREVDDSDRRRTFLGLTREGERTITRYLIAASRHVRQSQPVPFMLVKSEPS